MANCGSCIHFDYDAHPGNEPCKYCGLDGMNHNGPVYGISYYRRVKVKTEADWWLEYEKEQGFLKGLIKERK